MRYETLIVEQRGRVQIVTLNRPKALNAINAQLASDLIACAEAADQDANTGCLLITGNEKAFSAGADIKEMKDKSFVELYADDKLGNWQRFTNTRKPKIAAVNGVALGGGCELAMMCDFIIAAETARFGQPEIKLGVLPGWGGSQRLTRLVGRAKAMDLCLTGRLMDAQEAERAGLVARVVPSAKLMDEALEAATAIAGMSLPAALMVKECVNRAEELSLADGLLFERRVFYSAFATADQKEGMSAFIEKRKPEFKNA